MKPRLEAAIVASLCAIFTALALLSSARQSPTFDETSHLAAGVAELIAGDYRLNPEHPPLLKELAALPVVLSGADGPRPTGAAAAAWNSAPGAENAQWRYAYEWTYGVAGPAGLSALPTDAALSRADFVRDADRLFGLARLPLVALAVLLALGVYAWSRELHGPRGALLSLSLFCFSPSFLAHAPLVTTDAGFAAFFFACVWLFRRACRTGAAVDAVGAAACCALAFVSKFSAVLLIPALALLAVCHALEGPAAGRRRRATAAFGLLAGMLGAAYALLWAVYGFRYAGAPEAATGFRWAQALPDAGGGALDAVLRAARRWTLAPEGYLYGFSYMRARALERGAFLFGQRSSTGWWYYFPAAFALKTPLAALVLIAAGLARASRWERARLLAGPAVCLAAAMASHLNIGHRHILAAYPFLFVAAGAAATRGKSWRVAGLGAAASALSACLVFAPPWRPQAVYPDYLAYFNEAAGGPAGGWRALVDSDLDWGQGLKSLAGWLRARGVTEPVNLCYFGTAEPRFYGIRYVNLPGGLFFPPETPFAKARAPGWLAISATNLQGVYYDDDLRQAWTKFLRDTGARLEGTAGRSIFVYKLERAAL